MSTNQGSETFRMQVVRQADPWLAKACSGDKVAQMCVLAVEGKGPGAVQLHMLRLGVFTRSRP